LKLFCHRFEYVGDGLIIRIFAAVEFTHTAVISIQGDDILVGYAQS
jgi:hypothetical protein